MLYKVAKGDRKMIDIIGSNRVRRQKRIRGDGGCPEGEARRSRVG